MAGMTSFKLGETVHVVSDDMFNGRLGEVTKMSSSSSPAAYFQVTVRIDGKKYPVWIHKTNLRHVGDNKWTE